MKTEFPFTLPLGYAAPDGSTHHEGVMRLALARDEIEAMQHPLLERNEAYLSMVLLSRVVTRLGTLSHLDAEDFADFFAADLAYLEDLYVRINSPLEIFVGAVCPHCGNPFQLKVAPLTKPGIEEDAHD